MARGSVAPLAPEETTVPKGEADDPSYEEPKCRSWPGRRGGTAHRGGGLRSRTRAGTASGTRGGYWCGGSRDWGDAGYAAAALQPREGLSGAVGPGSALRP